MLFKRLFANTIREAKEQYIGSIGFYQRTTDRRDFLVGKNLVKVMLNIFKEANISVQGDKINKFGHEVNKLLHHCYKVRYNMTLGQALWRYEYPGALSKFNPLTMTPGDNCRDFNKHKKVLMAMTPTVWKRRPAKTAYESLDNIEARGNMGREEVAVRAWVLLADDFLRPRA